MNLPDAAAEFARQLAAALARDAGRKERVNLDCSCGAELQDLLSQLNRTRSLVREAEAHRDEAVAENERIGREIKAWARSAEKAREQRDDLLHAARAVTRPATWTATRMATLRAVVDRIEKELNGS